MEKEIKEDEINILNYLLVLVKHRKLIISITLPVAIITAIISLILPLKYQADTTILLPTRDSLLPTGILSQFGDVAELAGDVNSIRSPQTLISILKSRTVYDRIIDRFGLMKKYKGKTREKVRKRLGGLIKIKKDKMGSREIQISVINKVPETAADMANAFVEELKKRLQELAVTEASQRRLFFEEQLKQVKEELIASEEALREFQEKTGILNPDPLMPAARIPAVATGYIRKMRDLKYNEKLFEIMAKQYEIAKVDEAKDAVIIQVIDKAVPPEIKFKPKRKLMVMIYTSIAFFFAIVAVFFMEYIEKISNNKNDSEKIETLKRYLPFKRKK